MNLDLCNSQSGTDKMLQLKGKNTSQATLWSTESSASNWRGDTVPSVIVKILIHSLHCAHKGNGVVVGQWGQGQRTEHPPAPGTSCVWSWAHGMQDVWREKKKLCLVFNGWFYFFFNLFLSFWGRLGCTKNLGEDLKAGMAPCFMEPGSSKGGRSAVKGAPINNSIYKEG